jgi:8-oxo-dGTP pyrophosphatase MutT (NUDIX family)
MITRLRSAGIWISDAHILLESLADREVWGVPGGSVEEGESVEQACVREYLEETGLSLACNRLAIIHEHFWKNNGQPVREYGFYFIVSPNIDPGAQPSVKSLEGHMQFKWHPLSNLRKIDLVPRVLQVSLSDLPIDTLFISTMEESA